MSALKRGQESCRHITDSAKAPALDIEWDDELLPLQLRGGDFSYGQAEEVRVWCDGTKVSDSGASALMAMGDAFSLLRCLPSASVNAVVTSPPYWGQRMTSSPMEFGIEKRFSDHLAGFREFFSELARVVAQNGTVWINIGEKMAGSGCGWKGESSLLDHEKSQGFRHLPVEKTPAGYRDGDCLGLPEMVASAAREAGWIHRDTVTWAKTHARPNTRSRFIRCCERILVFAKHRRAGSYKFFRDRARIGDRSFERDFWEIPVSTNRSGHSSAYPLELPLIMVQVATDPGDLVLDPFSGTGTTALACGALGRAAIGVELSEKHHSYAIKRLQTAFREFEIDAPVHEVRSSMGEWIKSNRGGK